MYIKTGISILKKEKENAAGDCVLTKKYQNSDKLIAVLSDGLGSGIKANILSNLTATMLLGFAQNEADMTQAAEIVMNSLPVCKVRGISYSTFSIAIIDDFGKTNIIEEGNPDFLLVRNGAIVELEPKITNSKTRPNRHLKIYNFSLQMNDAIIFTSDGVTQAGLGSKDLKDGLERCGLIKVVLNFVKENPNFSPDELASRITSAAKAVSIGKITNDDTSALVLKAVEPKKAILFTGPPYNENEDAIWAKTFENFPGKKAVAGGTTAKILARELNREIITGIHSVGNLPSPSFMDGADLVTEGVLTLTRAEEYLNKGAVQNKNDAGAMLYKFLQSADEINFVVGAKVNNAHYDPNLPVEIELRKDVIKRIANILKEKYLKKVTIQYI